MYKKVMQDFRDKKINGLQRYAHINRLLNSNDPAINPKFNEMKNVIDKHFANASDPNEKVSIYCDTYAEVDAITEYLEQNYGKDSVAEFSGRTKSGYTKRTLKPAQEKDRFKNNQNCKFSIHTQAGTAGLNIQYDGKSGGATRMIVFSSGVKTWATIDQFFSRGNRKGALKDIDAHILSTDTPFDYKSQDRIQAKKDTQELLLDSKQFDQMNLLSLF